MCSKCGRFLITDRPVALQAERSSGTFIVIAFLLEVIGLVVFLGVRDAYTYQRRAMQRQAHDEARAVREVANPWRLDHPDAPCPTMESLREAHEITATSKITDPWDHVYRVECVADDTWVRSDGPDGKRGTNDDIVVPGFE